MPADRRPAGERMRTIKSIAGLAVLAMFDLAFLFPGWRRARRGRDMAV